MIESSVFEALLLKVEELSKRIKKLQNQRKRRLTKWLDNQDVCELLDISKTTLQKYRDRKGLPYSQVENKIYYKSEDIQNWLNSQIKKPHE